MISTPLFKKTFLLLLFVGIIAVISDFFYLYTSFWWLDTVVHFISGMTVAMASVLVWDFHYKKITGTTKSLIIGFVGAAIIGIIWEIFELHFGITSLAQGMYYFVDTTSDLLMDVCGGLFGGLYAHLVLTRSSKNKPQ